MPGKATVKPGWRNVYCEWCGMNRADAYGTEDWIPVPSCPKSQIADGVHSWKGRRWPSRSLVLRLRRTWRAWQL